MRAKEKFKVGDKVILSDRGKESFCFTRGKSGIIVGFPKFNEDAALIAREGIRQVAEFHESYWEVEK